MKVRVLRNLGSLIEQPRRFPFLSPVVNTFSLLAAVLESRSPPLLTCPELFLSEAGVEVACARGGRSESTAEACVEERFALKCRAQCIYHNHWKFLVWRIVRRG